MQVIDSGIGLVFTGSYEKRIINSTLIDKEPYILQFIIGEMIRSYTESAEKSRKIIAAKQTKKNKMQAGEIVAHNNIPKYFTFDSIHRRYIHNDNTEIVRELVKGILSGKSLYGMADSLNERKVKTFRNGYQWSGNAIRQILRNRVLIGEYLGCKNYVPPIIDEEKFNKIQNILNQNQFNRGQRGEIANIFRGICFCADENCGKSMTVAAQYKDYKTGKTFATPYRYLKCSVNGKHCACKNRGSFRLADMEEEFFLNFLFKNPLQLINEGDNRELNELNKAITSAQARLNKINGEIQKVVNLLADVPMAELKTKLTKLNEERDTVKNELDDLNSKVANVQGSPNTFANLKKLMGDFHIKMKSFKVDKHGFDNVDTSDMDKAILDIRKALKDEYAREGIRIMLPALIGKIVVDTVKGQFYVYNRMGKMIYESHVYESNRNCTTVWRRSLLKHKKAV